MTLHPGKPEDSRLGQVVGNRWRLTSVLGTGSTATVFAAEDAEHQRVAIKLLTPRAAERAQTRQRLAREAEVSRLLTHDSLVEVHSYNVTSTSETYIVMEFLEGEALAARLSRPPRPILDELLGIAWSLLDVLAVAHAAGVVHRDVKPANVMLLPNGRLKLLDFGIARIMGQSLPELPPVVETELGIALGTIPYMAPEQAQGRREAIDPRTDLFAVGAILFRAWSGRHVHVAPSPPALLELMASTQAPSLSAVKEDCPAGLTAIVDRALRFVSDARYPDACTMQRDVADVLEGRPPSFAVERLARATERTVLPESFDTGGSIAAQHQAPSPPPEPEPLGLEGTTLAGRYRVERKLGAGGMGAVYLAEHVPMRKAVALKVLHRELTYRAEVVARFEREAVAAARIDHPNVVTAKDFGRLDDGSFYLVLEYIQGESLRSALAAQSQLRPERAVSIAEQIAKALQAAHGVGIVHRDLKPENVMLLPQADGTELVKVLDFGIAKVTNDDGRDSELTKAGAVFGTPSYMSPEQAAGQAVDARTDLYTLGIVLFEMLAGHAPFTGGSPLAVLTAQLTEPPPQLPIRCSAALDEVVARLLRKDPEERFTSATELLRALDALEVRVESLPLPTHRPALAKGATTLAREKALEMLARLRGPEPSASSRVRRLLTYEVRIGTVAIRAWKLGVAATVLGAALATVPAILRGEDAAPRSTPSGRAVPSPVPPSGAELAALNRRARTGDRAALGALKRLPVARLGSDQWLASGLGWARLGEFEESVSAFERALALAPSLRQDRALVGTLRALSQSDVSERALQLLATRLGSVGPDLLYELWQTHGRDSPPVARALGNRAQQLLGSAPVRRAASPALLVALDLRLARSCHDYSKLLGDAARDADARSEPMLRRLTATRGCGFLGLGDCYGCLRGRGAQLTSALKAARKRHGPALAPAAVLPFAKDAGSPRR